MSYPIEYRRYVLSVREKEKLTIKQTSARFGPGVATITRWLKCLEPKKIEGRPNKIDLSELRGHVEKYPDAYQYERARYFGVTQNAIFEALQKIDMTYKKIPKTSQSRRRRTAILL